MECALTNCARNERSRFSKRSADDKSASSGATDIWHRINSKPAPTEEGTRRPTPAPPKEDARRLLTTEDVAAMLGIAPATAIWWRSQKQGPSWIRLGRGRRAPIRYRLEAVEAYLAQMESAEG
jgi:ferric-dicitrate binding protein FerR (iron transport regulator)